jgi:hypothetical protein
MVGHKLHLLEYCAFLMWRRIISESEIIYFQTKIKKKYCISPQLNFLNSEAFLKNLFAINYLV